MARPEHLVTPLELRYVAADGSHRASHIHAGPFEFRFAQPEQQANDEWGTKTLINDGLQGSLLDLG